MATIANEYQRLLDFPGGSVVKKFTCNAGDRDVD